MTILRTYNKEGYEISVGYDYDQFPDLSYIGTYSNTWKEDCIDVYKGPRYYRYFHPANPEYAMQDLKLMEDINDGTTSVLYLKVVASRKAVALGFSTLGNIITEDIESDLMEYLPDLEFEALQNAKHKLSELVADIAA